MEPTVTSENQDTLRQTRPACRTSSSEALDLACRHSCHPIEVNIHETNMTKSIAITINLTHSTTI